MEIAYFLYNSKTKKTKETQAINEEVASTKIRLNIFHILQIQGSSKSAGA